MLTARQVHGRAGLLRHLHHLPAAGHNLDEKDRSETFSFGHLSGLGCCHGVCCPRSENSIAVQLTRIRLASDSSRIGLFWSPCDSFSVSSRLDTSRVLFISSQRKWRSCDSVLVRLLTQENRWYSRYDMQKRYAAFYSLGLVSSGCSGILAYGVQQMVSNFTLLTKISQLRQHKGRAWRSRRLEMDLHCLWSDDSRRSHSRLDLPSRLPGCRHREEPLEIPQARGDRVHHSQDQQGP
jgi:hypothetical protein